MAIVTRIAAFLIASIILGAEPQKGPRLEVISVRTVAGAPRSPEFLPSFNVQPGGTFNVINLPVAFLVESAFEIRRDRIVGVPAWFDSQLFDVRARGTWGAERPTPEQVRALLLQVLEERFAFVAHHEERVGEAMILQVAQLIAATAAAKELGHPVIDRSGITALVDVERDYVPIDFRASSDGAIGPDGQSFVGAVRDQLGLRFNRSQERAQVLVIDELKQPSVN